jgi:hypothetical protein
MQSKHPTLLPVLLRQVDAGKAVDWDAKDSRVLSGTPETFLSASATARTIDIRNHV